MNGVYSLHSLATCSFFSVIVIGSSLSFVTYILVTTVGPKSPKAKYWFFFSIPVVNFIVAILPFIQVIPFRQDIPRPVAVETFASELPKFISSEEYKILAHQYSTIEFLFSRILFYIWLVGLIVSIEPLAKVVPIADL
jgi:hypothetical protein